MILTENESGTNASDLSTMPIPVSGRMSKLGLTMAWWSMCSAMFVLIVGATLATRYGARNAFIGMLLSVLFYTFVNGVFSRYAIRTGFSVALASQVVFGRAGAVIATLIFAATNIYYAVFESSVVAIAIRHFFPSLSFAWAALIVIGYSVPFVFGSVQKWLDKLNGVLLPFYFFGLVTAIVMATKSYGYRTDWIEFGSRPDTAANGWWYCFIYYMGCCALMMAAFDFARFGRAGDAKFHGWFNFGVPFWLMTFVVNGIAGIYLVATIPAHGHLSEVSVVFALLALMGIGGFGFVWVTQTRINTASYFLATLNVHAFFAQAFRLHCRRFVWLVVVGVLVYLLMLADVFTWLFQALQYQGVFIIAWVGVMLGHILFLRKDATVSELDGVRTIESGNVLAWTFGTIVGLVLMHTPYASFSSPATLVMAILGQRVAARLSIQQDERCVVDSDAA